MDPSTEELILPSHILAGRCVLLLITVAVRMQRKLNVKTVSYQLFLIIKPYYQNIWTCLS